MPEYKQMRVREIVRATGGLESALIETEGMPFGAVLDAHGIGFYAFLMDGNENRRLLPLKGNQTPEINAWVVSLLKTA